MLLKLGLNCSFIYNWSCTTTVHSHHKYIQYSKVTEPRKAKYKQTVHSHHKQFYRKPAVVMINIVLLYLHSWITL